MTLHRYQKLSKYLHVSDHETEFPEGHPQYDKLGNLRWLITHMQEKCPEFKHPDRHHTIDEGVCGFAGMVWFYSIQQYETSAERNRVVHQCMF